MALVGSVQNVIDQIGREILLLDAQAAKSLIPILSAAHAELGNDLAKILGQAGGDQKFTAQQYRNALAQMKKSLATLEKMHPAIFAQLTQNAYKAGMLAHGHLGQEMEKFGLMFQGEIRPFNLDNTRLLAEGQKTLMTHHASSAKRYAGQVGKDIRAQLAIGVARGETFDQLTARLVRLGGPGARGNTPADAANGLFKRHKYMAERLARTEVINAYNHHATEGIRELHQADPEIMKRWDSSLDVRACVICKDLHGRVAKPDEAFPGGYMRSPAHPNCRCAIVAWHKDWTESAIKTQEGEPAKPTGPSLAEQAAKIKAEGKIKPDGSGGASGKLPNRPKTKKAPAPTAPEKAKEAKQAHEKAVQETKKLLALKDMNFLLKQEVTPAFVEEVAQYLKVPSNTVPQALKELKKDQAKADKAVKLAQAAQAKADKAAKGKQDKLAAAQAKADKAQGRKLARNAPKLAPAAPVEFTPGAKITTNDLARPQLAGNGGKALVVDTTHVEGQALQVREIIGKDGKPYHEIGFKLTEDKADEVVRHAGGKIEQWHYPARKLDAGGFLVDMPDEEGRYYQYGKREVRSGNGLAYTVDVGTSGAHLGRVRITVPGGDPAKTLEALEHYGKTIGVPTTTTPTDEDTRKMIAARAASKVYPKGRGRDRQDDPLVQKIVKDAKVEEVYPGHVAPRSKALADKIAPSISTLIHDTGAPAHGVADMITGTGLMPSSGRFNAGVFYEGKSTPADFETGGADGVFVRVRRDASAAKATRGGYRILIDPEEVGRLDWWAFNEDRYGSASAAKADQRWSAGAMADPKYFTDPDNEIMFQGGIPPGRFRGVVCRDAASRKKLLDDLRAKGHTQINGVPVEEFITQGSGAWD